MHTHSYNSAEYISRRKTARPLSMCILNFNKYYYGVFQEDYTSLHQQCEFLLFHTLERSSFVFYEVLLSVQFSSVQSLSRVRLLATPWIAAHQVSLSIPNSRNSLRLTSIESVMPSSHLILGHPLLLLPPIPPSIKVFSNESTLHMRWPKYWSFSFSIIPSKEHPGLISFRMD